MTMPMDVVKVVSSHMFTILFEPKPCSWLNKRKVRMQVSDSGRKRLRNNAVMPVLRRIWERKGLSHSSLKNFLCAVY